MTSGCKTLIKVIVLSFLGMVIYARIFHAPFTFDDDVVFLRNPALLDLTKGFSSLQAIWKFQPSRFIPNLSIAGNVYWGHFDPFGYHLTNFILHLFVVGSVWYLARLMLSIRFKNHLPFDVPFWSALLFLVHPLHTESVSYTSQRCTIVMAFFYLMSLIVFIHARMSKEQGQTVLLLGASALLGICSFLSKEIAISLPVAWMLMDYFLFNRKPRKEVWLFLIGAAAVVALCFDFNFYSILTTNILSQSHRGDELSLGTYLLTQLRVSVVFLKLLFVPVGLNIDYDFPMSHHLGEWPALLSLVFLSGLILSAVVYRKKYWFLSFAIGWFFTSLLGHYVPLRANVIAEHKLYLTLAVMIPLLVGWLSVKAPRGIFIGIMMTLAVVYALLTFERNQAWADPVALWTDTARKSPHKPRAYISLGYEYFKQKNYEQAMMNYHKAISIAPEYYQPYVNIAEIYTIRKDYDEALAWVNQAIRVNPNVDVIYLQRAVLLDKMQRFHEAVADFDRWLAVHPNDGFALWRKKQNLQLKSGQR